MKRRTLLRTGASGLMGLLTAPLLGDRSANPLLNDCCPTEDEIRLCCNENPYGPSPLARKAIVQSAQLGNRYPQAPIQALKEAIAKANGVTSDQVLIAPGSVSVLRLVAWWLARQKKAVLSSDFTFQWLIRFAKALGSESVAVPIKDSMHFDLGAIQNRLDKDIGLVYLCNPNNPTGTSLPLPDIHDFCRTVSPDFPVFLDEAYVEYLPGFSRNNSAALLKDHPQLMISRTFSKIYGMAGMRVGYLLAAPGLINELENLDIGFGIGVSNISASAAMASLSDTEFITNSLALNEQSRSYTQEQLTRWGIPNYESSANFICCELSAYDAVALKEALSDAKISLNPFSRDDKTYMRITLGRPEEMQAVVERMDHFFTKNK